MSNLHSHSSDGSVSKSCCFLSTAAVLFLSECLVTACVHLVNFSLIAGSSDFLSHIGIERCVGLSLNREESNYLYLFPDIDCFIFLLIPESRGSHLIKD